MQSEPPPKHLNVSLDFDKLRESNTRWVRRAYIFLGIGTNAAAHEPLIPFELSSRSRFDYGTSAANENDHRHFLAEFESWIIGNALRELAEGHSTFLAVVHRYLRVVLNPGITYGQLERKNADFDKNNLLRRREKLARLLNIQDPYAEMFAAVVQARNCFAHRNGVIGHEDIQESSGAFEMKWRSHGLMIKGEYWDVNRDESVFLEADQAIQFGPIERSKVFRIGEHLSLTRHELAEIIFGFYVAAEVVLEPFRQLALAQSATPNASDSPGG